MASLILPFLPRTAQKSRRVVTGADGMQCVLTVHLHHLGDIEPLTHPQDTHAVVEVKGIAGKEMWSQAAGLVTWLPMSSVGLWASVSLCV